MNKRVISKVGKRQRPEIDMMEYIQLDDVAEFNLDAYIPAPQIVVIKKKYVREDVENEHNDQLVDIIENNEV